MSGFAVGTVGMWDQIPSVAPIPRTTTVMSWIRSGHFLPTRRPIIIRPVPYLPRLGTPGTKSIIPFMAFLATLHEDFRLILWLRIRMVIALMKYRTMVHERIAVEVS